MRTNIVLDEKLAKEAFKYSQVKTKEEKRGIYFLLDLEGGI